MATDQLPAITNFKITRQGRQNESGTGQAASEQKVRDVNSFLKRVQLGSLAKQPRPGDIYRTPRLAGFSAKQPRPLGLLPDHDGKLDVLKELARILPPIPIYPQPPPPPINRQGHQPYTISQDEKSSHDVTSSESMHVHVQDSQMVPMFRISQHLTQTDLLKHEMKQLAQDDPDYMHSLAYLNIKDYYTPHPQKRLEPSLQRRRTQTLPAVSKPKMYTQGLTQSRKPIQNERSTSVQYVNFTDQAQLFDRHLFLDQRYSQGHEPCERCRLRGGRCARCKAIRTGGGYIILDGGKMSEDELRNRFGKRFGAGRHSGYGDGMTGPRKHGRRRTGQNGDGNDGMGANNNLNDDGRDSRVGGLTSGGDGDRGGWGGVGDGGGLKHSDVTDGGGRSSHGMDRRDNDGCNNRNRGLGDDDGHGQYGSGFGGTSGDGQNGNTSGDKHGRSGAGEGLDQMGDESGRQSNMSARATSRMSGSRPGSTMGARPGSSMKKLGRGGGGRKRNTDLEKRSGGGKGDGDDQSDSDDDESKKKRRQKKNKGDGDDDNDGDSNDGKDNLKFKYERPDTEEEDTRPHSRGPLIRFKKKRDDVKALHATLKELQGIDPLDYLAKYCIIDQTRVPHYRHAYDNVDRDEDDEIDIAELDFALKTVNYDLISDAEMNYVHSVLELAGRYKLNFRLFSLIAALSEKVVSLEDMVKRLINKMDFEALEVKMKKCKELFYLLADSECPVGYEGGVVTSSSLAVELQAGGLTEEHVDFVVDRLNHEGKGIVEFLDYLTYVPLFLEIHDSIYGNPLDFSRTK